MVFGLHKFLSVDIRKGQFKRPGLLSLAWDISNIPSDDFDQGKLKSFCPYILTGKFEKF